MDFVCSLPLHEVVFPLILSSLSIEELFALRAVSKQYCKVVGEYLKQCFTLDLSKIVQKTKFTPESFRILTEGNHVVRELVLTDGNHWLVDDIFVPVVCFNPHLTKIDITNCSQLTNRSLAVLSDHCKLLTYISLQGCHWVNKDYFLALVSNNPKLEFLNVGSCWNLDDNCMWAAAKACPNLVFLSVSKCYSISDQTVEKLAAHCPNVRKLDLTGCWRISDQGIRVAGEYFEKLEGLCVKDCQNVTERSLKRIRDLKVKVDIAPWSQEITRNVQFGVFQLPTINLQI